MNENMNQNLECFTFSHSMHINDDPLNVSSNKTVINSKKKILIGYSRPNSETNSLVQSCSSALSGVDDKRLDDILGDGIRNQNLRENQVRNSMKHFHKKSHIISGCL